MWVVICYDIATSSTGGPKRLRKVARACQDWGQRVQYSIFECDLNETQWATLKLRLLDIIDPQQDRLRFYFLGEREIRRAEHHGINPPTDFDEPLVI